MKKYLINKIFVLVVAVFVIFTPLALRVIYADDPLPTDTPTATASPDPLADPSPTDTPIDVPTNTPEETILPTPSVDPNVGVSSESALSATDSPSPTPTSEAIVNDNSAVVTNDVNTDAESGDNNLTDASGSATLQSGDALALVNLLNLLNINVVGSDFATSFIDTLENGGQIDLNAEWNQMDEAQVSDYNSLISLIQNTNRALLINNVNLNSVSGSNEMGTAGGADVSSGNSTSLANIINLVNINILDSKFLASFINITASGSGDIILPNPGYFLNPSLLPDPTGSSPENNNQAVLENNLNAGAQSGDINLAAVGGNLTAQSGDATALTDSYSLVNLNLYSDNWFFLIVNKLGNWDGSVIGWQNPGSIEKQDQISQLYAINSLVSSPIPESSPAPEFVNNNQAVVENNINLNSTSGSDNVGNVTGDVEVKTGDATAIANLINMVNVNILGGHWFLGVINILSDWTGNLVFAYPNAPVSMPTDPGISNNSSSDNSNNLGDQRQPVLEITAKNNVNGFVYQGDTVTFDVTVKNTSDVPSYNTILTQNLFNTASDNLGQIQVNIGTLPAGKTATVTFGTTLTDKDVLLPGSYYTVTQVVGQAENGNSVSSNEVKTYFDIKAKIGGTLMGELGKVDKGNEVLGAATTNPGEGSPSLLSEYEKYLPYVFVASVILYLAIGLTKRKINGKSLLPAPVVARIAGITSIFFALVIILFNIYRRNW
jgi:hypothetical protein